MTDAVPSVLIEAPNERLVAMDTNKVVLRPKKIRGGRDRGNQNGVSRPKSEFFSPSGISTLDIRTRLRITEAELALVQREVSDLLVERNTLESSSRQYEDSWRFAVKECGRIVEQKNEVQQKLETLQQVIASNSPHTADLKGKGRGRSTKSNFEQLKLQLETQTRVAESIEHERDRAYDDFVMAQAQIHTLMRQYQDLAGSCSEVARERDKARAEVQLLREELHRYEPEDCASSRNSLRKVDSLIGGSHGSLASLGGGGGEGDDSGPALLADPTLLLQHVKEVKQERDKATSRYEQAMKRAEQYQKQLYRAEDDRRQALATSEALTALWQKKFEKAQNENYDLRQELLSAQDRISLMHDKFAMARIQSREVTPSRPSPPDYMDDYVGGTPSPTKMFSGHSGMYLGAQGYSHSQATTSITPSPTPLPPTFLSQSNTAPNIVGLAHSRRNSLTSSQERIPPSTSYNYGLTSPLKSRFYHEDMFEGSHSTDDESSWI